MPKARLVLRRQGASADGAVQPFARDDEAVLAGVRGVAAALLRGVLAERDTQAMLADALQGALRASASVQSALGPGPAGPLLDQLRDRLDASVLQTTDADELVRLADLLRGMAARHGHSLLPGPAEMFPLRERRRPVGVGPKEGEQAAPAR